MANIFFCTSTKFVLQQTVFWKLIQCYIFLVLAGFILKFSIANLRAFPPLEFVHINSSFLSSL